MKRLRAGPRAGYLPDASKTAGLLSSLAALQPSTLAVMHGTSYHGTCGPMLTDLAEVIRESFEQS